MATAVSSIVESSKVRIVEKLRAEAFQRYAYDAELEAFEKELRHDLHQRGMQLSWDANRVELQEAQGIVVDKESCRQAPDARSDRPYPSTDPVADLPPAPNLTLLSTTQPQSNGADPVADLPPGPNLTLLPTTQPQSNGSGLPLPGEQSPAPSVLSLQQLPEVRPSAPTPRGRDEDDGDDFGEDLDEFDPKERQSLGSMSKGGSKCSSRRPSGEVGSSPLTGEWHLQSQLPYLQGAEHCTLTILENACEELIQFELMKHRTNAQMRVTCTNAQFDGLCKEQTGLVGTAQINAAIAQLFREAVEEVEKPAPIDEDHDDFGEDHTAEFSHLASPKAPDTATEAEARWHIKSQQPWQHGQEHCTLTILENSVEGRLQFELVKNRSNTTMHVTCTIAQFDELLNEQTGVYGAAQTNAAIAQLFEEAHEEVAHDEFGEDSLGEESALISPDTRAIEADAEARWHVKSQMPWQLGREHCTLTILENTGEGLVQFELIKNSNHTTMHVTCTNQQFDDIMAEQTGLSGAAQTNAAISQLFQEAHEEIEKPTGGLDPVDEFGEDFGEEFSAMATSGPRTSISESADPQSGWHIKSQQPWQLGLEHCTLTILENAGEDSIKFQLVKNSSHVTMTLTCTNEQFDGLLKEQTGLIGTAQTNAAISQLFKEAHEEIEKPTGECSTDDFGEDFGQEFSAAAGATGAKESSEPRWHTKSQQPWELKQEHCTLTILEDKTEGLVQFELLKLSNHTTMYVTCTNQQFDDLLKEQTGLCGTAQVNAAISQLFEEAHDEVEHDEFGEDAECDAAVGAARIDRPIDDTSGAEDAAVEQPGAKAQSDLRWQIQSQQPWQLGQEHCTLTILENKGDNLLQFELLKLSTHTTVYVMCTNAQFDSLCKEQTGLSGTAQINAALAQLFREAQDEMQSKS